MVFQSLALYSNKTIFENLASPLKVRKTPEDEIRMRVQETARTLRIEHTLNRYPATLSGGEKQRVALGRALIRKPRLFLLDEPLSNLDALLRLEMRTELKRLQAELKQTIIFTTHDQMEALSIADRILLMREGEIQQCGTPEAMYYAPANRFVANFIGSPTMNFIDCSLTVEGDRVYLDSGAFRVDATGLAEAIKEYASGSELILGVRPEHVYVWDKPRSEKDFQATVDLIEPLGNMTIIHFTVDSTSIKAVGSGGYLAKKGEKKWLSFDRGTIHVFDKKTEKAVL